MVAPTILIYHPAADVYAASLRRHLPEVTPLTATREDELRALLPDAEVLVAFQFPVQALEAAKRLRWIQITSAGTEFLRHSRRELGHAIVTNGRGIHAAPIADYALTAAVMLQSDWLDLLRAQAARQWRRRPVRALAGHTFGVVGLGSIGREIARRASASGMQVTGLSRRGAATGGIVQVYRPDQLHAFLGDCDFVTLAVPLTEETRSMISAAEFRAMKRSAFIINVSRGAVVDEGALVEALRTGTIAGACLDVFETEPLPPESALWTMRNVIVTPHLAGMRIDYEDRLMDIFADNLQRFCRGEALRNVVDPGRGY